VPALGDLGWPRAEGLAYALLVAGTAALAAGVALGAPAAIRASGLGLMLGALAFAAALGRVLAHLAVPARPAGAARAMAAGVR
jgi:hypothetical protein